MSDSGMLPRIAAWLAPLPGADSAVLIGDGIPVASLPGTAQAIAAATLEAQAIAVPRGRLAVTVGLHDRIDPLTLFERVGAWLEVDGHWLVWDRFWAAGQADAPETSYRQEDCLAFAKRMGLVLVDQAEVMPPARDMNEDGAAWRLFLFKKEKEPIYSIGWARRSDEAELLRLFEAAFGHVMAPARWRWKYRHMERPGTVVRKAGEIVAFYGGMSRPIRFFGEPAWAVQIGDVMVHPEERGRFLARTGPFFLSTTTFLERSIGFGRRYLLGFGFPSRNHMRLAEKLRLYDEADRVMELAWPSTGYGRVWWLACDDYVPERDAGLVERWWREMAADYRDAIIAVRDADHIRERYLQHPEWRYRVLRVRNRLLGRHYGLIVLREREADCQIVDILAPRRHQAAMIGAARASARAAGKAQLTMWLTADFAAELAGKTGGGLRDTDISIPANAWTPHPPTEGIRGKWWLTAGDADFT